MPRIPRQSWLLAVVSAALQAVIFPSVAWTFLAWIAFVPLLVALLDEDLAGAQGFRVAYLSGVVWYAATCFWIFHTMHVYGNLSKSVAAGVLVLFCFYLGLYHGVFGWAVVWVARRTNPTAALLFAPVLWVGVELARYHITGFPWALLGTAAVDNQLVTMIAPFSGVYGVSFVIMAVNALVATFFLLPSRNLGIAGMLAAAAFQAGTLYKRPPLPTTHEAVLLQPNLPILNSPWSPEYFDNTVGELVDVSRRASNANAPAPRLIVWPESPAPFYINDPKFRSWLGALANEKGSYLIAGTLGVRGNDNKVIFNSASLVAPTGQFVDRYDKIHLVPFGEYVPFQQILFFAESLTREVSNFSRGNARNVLRMEAGGGLGKAKQAGVFICYESVFPDEVRQFAANGAQVFVNISNDEWFGKYGAPGQHLNMARMRAIENRRWILRSTNSGVTASIDPYGRVVARAERHVRTALVAPYAYVGETTFYTRHGDWFAYACAIISLVALLVRVRFRAGRMVP
jgi:apolipoprotein N-acyltransferase